MSKSLISGLVKAICGYTGREVASGKVHDSFNLIVALCLVPIILPQFSLITTLSFYCGYLLSTFFLGPDLDLGPKKRAGLIGMFLYPYSLFFRHRGRSHSIVWGSLSRVVYLVVLVFILRPIYFAISDNESLLERILLELSDLQMVFQKKDSWVRPEGPLELVLFASFVGMWVSDFCHILLDRLSSLLKWN